MMGAVLVGIVVGILVAGIMQLAFIGSGHGGWQGQRSFAVASVVINAVILSVLYLGLALWQALHQRTG